MEGGCEGVGREAAGVLPGSGGVTESKLLEERGGRGGRQEERRAGERVCASV